MRLTIAPEIFARFPDLEMGIVCARGIDNMGTDREIEAFFRHALLEAGLLLKLKPVEKDPTVLFYRNLLSKMGATGAIPSMEARLAEVAAGIAAETESGKFSPGQTAGLIGVTALARKTPITDLTRGAEIQFRLPVFAFDMKTENGEITVRESNASDTYETEKGIDSISEKEPIFAFGTSVSVRHLFCEQGLTGAVTKETRDVLIALPCFSQNRRRAMSARNEIARRIKDSFGRDTEADWLSSTAPDFVSGL